MKYTKFIILPLVIIMFGFTIGCERDDICPASTSTTPSLVIETYDNIITENKKSVFKLRIQGINNEAVLEGYNVVTKDEIILPLRTDTTATQYRLYKEYVFVNDSTPPEGNEDIITIRYKTEEVYVSKACGYKMVFKNISLTIEDDGDNWILSREAINDNQSVEDETATHFNIFH
jgi:hypothetical protein